LKMPDVQLSSINQVPIAAGARWQTMRSTLNYWCDSGLEITVSGPGGDQIIHLSKPYARIGSLTGSDVLLNDPSIASRAAYLHATDGGVWCIPLAVSVDKPAKPILLQPNARLSLGQYRMSVRRSHARGRNRLGEGGLGSDLTNGFRLKVQSGVTNPQILSVTDTFVVVGRERPSTMILPDEHLSRVHCVLFRQSDVLWVIDLLSSNGTKYRDQKFELSRLEPGDFIGVGGHQIRLCVPGESDDRPHSYRGQVDANEELVVERTVVREQRVQVTTRVVRRRVSKSELDAGFENEIEAPIRSRFETEPPQRIPRATTAGIEGQRQGSQSGQIKLAQAANNSIPAEKKPVRRLEFVEPNKKMAEQEVVEVGMKNARPINAPAAATAGPINGHAQVPNTLRDTRAIKPIVLKTNERLARRVLDRLVERSTADASRAARRLIKISILSATALAVATAGALLILRVF
jgi:pSer/pThr/pTyr-binding forkhead associated (FHA) protein